MVELQLEQLNPEEQRVLEVASVARAEFSAAAVAAGIEAEVETVEEVCERLVRRSQFLYRAGTAAWPDGTVAASYGFTHALYQHVLYERVAVGRGIELHRRIGARKEAAYGQRAGEIAVELAVHFERARQYERAVLYREYAAQQALQRYAYGETISHLTRGLALLTQLSDSPACAVRTPTTPCSRRVAAGNQGLSGPGTGSCLRSSTQAVPAAGRDDGTLSSALWFVGASLDPG
jgi:predicted ATPase